MRRWGQLAEPKPDAWYDEMARRVYRPELWRKAAELLVAEGRLDASALPETDGYKPPTGEFIDGVVYDGRAPNAYLAQFEIGRQGRLDAAAARP
jgi:nitrate/nitrite transport system substrate-binding protein